MRRRKLGLFEIGDCTSVGSGLKELMGAEISGGATRIGGTTRIGGATRIGGGAMGIGGGGIDCGNAPKRPTAGACRAATAAGTPNNRVAAKVHRKTFIMT